MIQTPMSFGSEYSGNNDQSQLMKMMFLNHKMANSMLPNQGFNSTPNHFPTPNYHSFPTDKHKTNNNLPNFQSNNFNYQQSSTPQSPFNPNTMYNNMNMNNPALLKQLLNNSKNEKFNNEQAQKKPFNIPFQGNQMNEERLRMIDNLGLPLSDKEKNNNPSDRNQKIEKYKSKKRNWKKKISYDCRKKVADTRLRIKGRFISKKVFFFGFSLLSIA